MLRKGERFLLHMWQSIVHYELSFLCTRNVRLYMLGAFVHVLFIESCILFHPCNYPPTARSREIIRSDCYTTRSNSWQFSYLLPNTILLLDTMWRVVCGSELERQGSLPQYVIIQHYNNYKIIVFSWCNCSPIVLPGEV